MDLANFFSASEARTDRWRQLNAAGRAWEAAVAQRADPMKTCTPRPAAFRGDRPLESYWAYPGPRLMATVAEALEERNAGVFARLVQKISIALLTGAYRHDTRPGIRCRRTRARSRRRAAARRSSRARGTSPTSKCSSSRPTTRARGNAPGTSCGACAGRRTPFNYEIVQVGSFEDGDPRRHLQLQRAGGRDLRRLPVPLPPRPAGDARVPARASARVDPASIAARRARPPRSRATIKNYPAGARHLPAHRPRRRDAGRQRGGRADPAHLLRRRRADGDPPRDPRRRQRPLRHALTSPTSRNTPAPDRHLPRAADRPRQVHLPVELDPRHGPVLRHQPLPRRVVGDDRRPRQPARADRQHQEGAGDGGARLRRRARLSSPPTAPRPPTRSSCRRSASRATSCWSTATATSRTTTASCWPGAQPLLRRGLSR